LTRITHPANGIFDVVVMQSSPSEELPEAAGLLTGNPVYTVYLNTGAEREWLLEYCVPGRTGSPSSAYEVTVGDTAPVSPPYPISTVVPTGVLRQRHTRHILLHVVLTASGRFRDMSAADAGSVVARQVLEVLGDWQFRPAMKENKPIDVEVLLAIPPQT
jgi:hypothetical protein